MRLSRILIVVLFAGVLTLSFAAQAAGLPFPMSKLEDVQFLHNLPVVMSGNCRGDGNQEDLSLSHRCEIRVGKEKGSSPVLFYLMFFRREGKLAEVVSASLSAHLPVQPRLGSESKMVSVMRGLCTGEELRINAALACEVFWDRGKRAGSDTTDLYIVLYRQGTIAAGEWYGIIQKRLWWLGG